jgi:hypothetical protein
MIPTFFIYHARQLEQRTDLIARSSVPSKKPLNSTFSSTTFSIIANRSAFVLQLSHPSVTTVLAAVQSNPSAAPWQEDDDDKDDPDVSGQQLL